MIIESQVPLAPVVEPVPALPTPKKSGGLLWLFVFLLLILSATTAFFVWQNIQLREQLTVLTSSIPTPSPVISPTPNPTDGWKTMDDENNGYQIKIPDGWKSYLGMKDTERFVNRIDDWEVMIDGETKSIQSSLIIEKCFPPNCIVEVNRNLGSGVNKPVSQEKITMAGYSAVKETYLSEDSPWMSKKSFRLVIDKEDGIYIITWQDISPVFDQILSTFKFIDKQNLTYDCPDGWTCEQKTNDFYGGNYYVFKNSSGSLGLTITPIQQPYGFGNPSLTKEKITLEVENKAYEANQVTVDDRAVYVDTKVTIGSGQYFILFGTGYPATEDKKASIVDYNQEKNTFLEILASLKH